MSVTEDYLNCPHCNAKVPKKWEPAQGEGIPEETSHKMLAFSRRILNGRNVSGEVIYALESLVRHYGSTDETDKALGVGYARLGEHGKAEQYLLQARRQVPEDGLVLRHLLEVLVAQEQYHDAVEVGRALLELSGKRPESDDVARLARALVGLGADDEAKALLAAHPELDPRNPLVKKARKQLNKNSESSLRTFFSAKGPIQRLFGGAGREGLRTLRRRAGAFMGSVGKDAIRSDALPFEGRSEAAPAAVPEAFDLGNLPAFVEYWVYARQTDSPKWEEIRDVLAQQLQTPDEAEKVFRFLEAQIEKDRLAIEYILKQDAGELFDYPEELIPHNSREFGDDDRKTLQEAEMIVRVRLTADQAYGFNHLLFMAQFVESIRNLTGGVVQDAVSHILWGSDSWKRGVADGQKGVLVSHINFEALDEEGKAWIHTHGMQKFGLPDMEMEHIPADHASNARRLMLVVADILFQMRAAGRHLRSPLAIPNTPVLVGIEARAEDEEGHFPAGSLRLLPSLVGKPSERAESVSEALNVFSTAVRSVAPVPAVAQPDALSGQPTSDAERPPGTEGAREEYLTAHRKAIQDLQAFKRSFEEGAGRPDTVHAVKVGFPAPGATYEWMWVSLQAWRSGALVGCIENSPVIRKDLPKGTLVQIDESEIFDWVVARGGTVETGAYTEGIAS
ncbi:MAG: DUF2314 domain-containing protein [Desulfomonile tiedjei]|nr:DUF2314 domain-containing protein [Desulfomonile tiedjei]